MLRKSSLRFNGIGIAVALAGLIAGCSGFYWDAGSAKPLLGRTDRAKALAAAGDWQGAERLLDGAVRSGNPYALLAQGRLLLAAENPLRDPARGRSALAAAAAKNSAWDGKIAYELGTALAEGGDDAGDRAQARLLLERATNAGVPMASTNLARLLESSADAGDRQRATELFREAARDGDPRAQAWLLEKARKDLPRSPEVMSAATALESRLRSKAESGDAGAARELAHHYASGSFGSVDSLRARAWWERLAADGDVSALRKLAEEAASRQDPAARERWLSALADLGDGQAMLKLAELAEADGRIEAALSWAERARIAGTSGAAGRVVRLATRNGDLSRAKPAVEEAAGDRDAAALTAFGRAQRAAGDRRGAVSTLKLAADLGDEHAMAEVGTAYLKGEGVSRDVDVARQYLESAAAKGHPVAMLQLARILIDHDEPARAEVLLRRAVDAGSKVALHELGRRKLAGIGLSRDTAVGTRLLARASAAGDAAAAYSLGKAYLDGKLLPPDRAEAARHLKVAAAGGSKNAADLLARL